MHLIARSIYVCSSHLWWNICGDFRSCHNGSVNTTDIAGKIVLCYAPSNVSSTLPQIDLGTVGSFVLQAGGKGLIYAQYTTDALIAVAGCGEVPCVLVDFEIATQILNYIDTSTYVTLLYYYVHLLVTFLCSA